MVVPEPPALLRLLLHIPTYHQICSRGCEAFSRGTLAGGGRLSTSYRILWAPSASEAGRSQHPWPAEARYQARCLAHGDATSPSQGFEVHGPFVTHRWIKVRVLSTWIHGPSENVKCSLSGVLCLAWDMFLFAHDAQEASHTISKPCEGPSKGRRLE